MIEFWTKNSHYRVDLEAQTVERLSPDPFPPRKVYRGAGALERGPDRPQVGCRYFLVWEVPDEHGRDVLHTTRIQRVEEN